jgi:hypothetical protein
VPKKNQPSKADKIDASTYEIKTIVLGLFALIGFIVLIASIFMGVVGE